MSEREEAWPEIDPDRAAQLKSALSAWNLPTDNLPLFEQAFSHSSYAFENKLPGDNERLEFLGDAVLGFIVADLLFERSPDAEEGELSKHKAALVNRAILGRQARAMGLGALIQLGRGQAQSGGRQRASIIGSALEALVGAVYLVFGLDTARAFCERHILKPCEAYAGQPDFGDFKSRFQEFVQKHLQDTPEYRLVSATGPDHDRRFVIEALAGGVVYGRGEGKRKKNAENDAARVALARFQSELEPRDSLSAGPSPESVS